MKRLKPYIHTAFIFSFMGIISSCHLLTGDEVNKNSTNIETTKVELPLVNTNRDSIHKEIADTLELNKTPIDSTKQYIYLTFDDGPYKGSHHINNIIKEEQIKATVFIVGLNAYTEEKKQFIEDYKNNELIEVANHTYTHARNKYTSYYNNPDGVLKDVMKNDTFFEIKNRFVRLPGRNVWRLGNLKKNDHDKASTITANKLAENQYYLVGWDYEWNRNSKKHPLDNPEKIYNGIVYRLEHKMTLVDNHLVILMHDDMFDNEADAEKLRKLIRLIKNNQNMVLEFTSNYPFKIS